MGRLAVDGREHLLSADDVILTMRAPEGYSVEREGAHAVALDLAIDEELREEGHAREIVHAVQNARKTAGLQVEDRIELWLTGDAGPDRGRRRRTASYLAGETLAVALNLGENGAERARRGSQDGYREQAEIDGLELTISCARPPPLRDGRVRRRPSGPDQASSGLELLLELLLGVGADDGLDRLRRP